MRFDTTDQRISTCEVIGVWGRRMGVALWDRATQRPTVAAQRIAEGENRGVSASLAVLACLVCDIWFSSDYTKLSDLQCLDDEKAEAVGELLQATIGRSVRPKVEQWLDKYIEEYQPATTDEDAGKDTGV